MDYRLTLVFRKTRLVDGLIDLLLFEQRRGLNVTISSGKR